MLFVQYFQAGDNVLQDHEVLVSVKMCALSDESDPEVKY